MRVFQARAYLKKVNLIKQEVNNASNTILNIIQIFKDKYGNKLFGGNCGTFAIALHKIIQQQFNIYANPCILCEDYEESIGIKDITDSQKTVYHIFLQINNI